MTLKQTILDQLVKYKIDDEISTKRKLPKINDLYLEENIWIDNIFASKNIPKEEYRSNILYENYNNNILRILSCITSIFNSTNNLAFENEAILSKYNLLYEKSKYRLPFFKDQINRLLAYSCYNIDTGYSNQTDESSCSKIGKFITLPFFMNSAELYNGDLSISEISNGDVTFSNIGALSYMPFVSPPSIKILSKEKNISYKMNINLAETINGNAFYIKVNNAAISITTSFILNGKNVYSETTKSNEVLLSFDKVEFNTILIDVSLINTNTDKPLSVQIDDILIFKNIIFSQNGTFECKTFNVGNTKDTSILNVTYRTGSYNQDSVNTMLSISSNPLLLNYNNVYKDENIDISLYKFKYSFDINNAGLDELGKNINGINFDSYTIPKTDSKWDIDFKNSSIIYGINKDYINLVSPSASAAKSNWTKSGNYYVTSILNYFDNVYINIGSMKCKINGKEYTGNIKIPVGFSVIEVHEMDINLDFGDITKANDTINPYNFAYIFSGVPVYNSSGTLTQSDVKTKQFNIKSINTIELGDSFIPLTESITDSYGYEYKLSLCKIPNTPGTYTIEPYSGRIRIYPVNNVKNVSISYIAANPNRRPAGILFNRLLTFGNMNSLLQSNNSEKVLFGFDGSYADSGNPERYIILPKLETQPKYSQILYNLNEDKVYSSIKINMSTGNKYKTPTVSDIFLSVK